MAQSNMQAFVVIKCVEELLGLPQKVIAPIPEQGITESFKNEVGDLPSIGAGAWSQALGKRGEQLDESIFRGLKNILAAESLWIGGNKRIFSLNLEFHAYEDPYSEVYLPVKALQMMTLPRDADTPQGKNRSLTEAAQGFTQSGLKALGVSPFYYSSPPNVSFIVYSILEQNVKNVSERKINDPESLLRETRTGQKSNQTTITEELLSRKSILIYSPKAMISSLDVNWIAPFYRSAGGLYPSVAKVQLTIDTLKVATSSDAALEKPSENSSARLRGISKTYVYN